MLDGVSRPGVRRLVIAAVLVVVAAGAFLAMRGIERESYAVTQETTGTGASLVETADTGSGDRVPLPRLLDLGADKCIPCKAMAPILEEMRETFRGRLDVDFIDVWKEPGGGREYGIKIIPTQIFFDEQGDELFRHQGFYSREDILMKWRELGYEFEE